MNSPLPFPIGTRWLLSVLTLLCSSVCSGVLWAGNLAPGRTQIVTRQLSISDAGALLWPRERSAAPRPATSDERQLIHDLVPVLLEAGTDAAMIAEWAERAAQADFVVERWQVQQRSYWVLREAAGTHRGAGSYVFRTDVDPRPAQMILQAPHAYFDRGTGAIAANVFFAAGLSAQDAPRALFTNSLHRYQLGPHTRRRRVHSRADVCHNARHLFNLATARATEILPHSVVVQLHGYGAGSAGRHTQLAGAEVIVSAGRRGGSTDLSRRVAWALRDILGSGVRRFPEEVGRLGGTRNVQGQVARRRGARFLHLELSRSVRRALLLEPALLDAFARALLVPRSPIEPEPTAPDQLVRHASLMVEH